MVLREIKQFKRSNERNIPERKIGDVGKLHEEELAKLHKEIAEIKRKLVQIERLFDKFQVEGRFNFEEVDKLSTFDIRIAKKKLIVLKRNVGFTLNSLINLEELFDPEKKLDEIDLKGRKGFFVIKLPSDRGYGYFETEIKKIVGRGTAYFLEKSVALNKDNWFDSVEEARVRYSNLEKMEGEVRFPRK